jgi:two-component sensor histidine kinase
VSPVDQTASADLQAADLSGTLDYTHPAPDRPPAVRHLRNFGLGLLAAQAAVLLRFWLKIPTDVLPFFLVVIAVCLITVQAGLVGGVTTMIAGGALTWFYLLDPTGSWSLDRSDEYALLGYFAITGVILATSQLYRLSEQKRQAVYLQLARQEATHQRLFAREMSHRLKNAMAIVQAMASQTFTRDTPEVDKFNGRLMALADAHNLLNEHVKQPTASVTEVVETAVQPFRDRPDRFRISGPDAPLPDQQVVSLAIALHELGTNAVKYGALGEDSGWVSIDWVAADGKIRIDWKEHDGPAVKTPTTKGFGSRLLARAAMGTELKFEKDGLRCTITARS